MIHILAFFSDTSKYVLMWTCFADIRIVDVT